MAMHWARVIELVYASEQLLELAQDPEITDTNIKGKRDTPGRGSRHTGGTARNPDPPLRVGRERHHDGREPGRRDDQQQRADQPGRQEGRQRAHQELAGVPTVC